MRFADLKAVGHNIADSFASGIGLLIGIYEMDVFAEAHLEPEGFLVVDFVTGTTPSPTASSACRDALRKYSEVLPTLCAKHGVTPAAFRKLEARYGTDRVYGRHFTVTVESTEGKTDVSCYVGMPGRKLRAARAGAS